MSSAFPAGTFTPDPRPAGPGRAVLATGGLELKLLLRNGEQLLLAVLIPLGVLLVMTFAPILELAEPRVNTITPGVLALAVMSSAFTSPAITTGFDRRYGVLKRFAAAGIGRFQMIAGKALAVLIVLAGQLLLIGLVALVIGWSPAGNPLWALLLLVLGAAAFLGLALLLGGTLRAEAVLAVANLVWLVLMGIGGIVLPLSEAPGWVRVVGELTPAGALSSGLRQVLTDGTGPAWWTLLVLAGWVLLGWTAAVRWFRWH